MKFGKCLYKKSEIGSDGPPRAVNMLMSILNHIICYHRQSFPEFLNTIFFPLFFFFFWHKERTCLASGEHTCITTPRS